MNANWTTVIVPLLVSTLSLEGIGTVATISQPNYYSSRRDWRVDTFVNGVQSTEWVKSDVPVSIVRERVNRIIASRLNVQHIPTIH